MAVGNTVLLVIILIISIVSFVVPQKLVVGGKKAKIKDFPHMARLLAVCEEDKYVRSELAAGHTCGSSILNQAIVITAAHCLKNCKVDTDFISVFVGKEKITEGLPYPVSSFKLHEKYNIRKKDNDIALVRLEKKIKFGGNVRRVALMKKTPYDEPAEIAGWGLIDVKFHYDKDEKNIPSKYLMHVSQKVWSRKDCMKKLRKSIPKGTICGGDLDSTSYIAHGDSGSGLMVRKHILIGIASYMVNQPSAKSLAVYTDIGHFYNWIEKSAKVLYCKSIKSSK